MTVLLDKPIVCPVTVGCGPELEALDQLLAEVRGGSGRVVLVSGEAGIGKSRLVAEAKRRAQGQDFAILQGNCFETDRSLPYGPLLDLLRGYMSAHTPTAILQEFGLSARELVKLLPELASLLPSREDAPPSVAPPSSSEQEKHQLFALLAQVFHRLATHQPLLLVVEDLHWSDDITLQFLLALARSSTNRPLVLLGTYRSDEVNAVLRHCLAQLDRTRLIQELSLQRLPPADVDAMVRAIFALNRPVRTEFLTALYRLTDGNPFFIEETLTSLLVYTSERKADRVKQGEMNSAPLPALSVIRPGTENPTLAALRAPTRDRPPG